MERMGCSSSTSTVASPKSSPLRKLSHLQNVETILQAYLRLESTTAKVESSSPSAHLASLLPLLENLHNEITKYDENQNFLTSAGEKEEEALLEVLVDLKISQDPNIAAEHEEFIANINRQVMKTIDQSLVEKEYSELVQNREDLEKEMSLLQDLYKEQDQLLERVLGTQYGSASERTLEGQVGGARALRDTVAAAAGSWVGATLRAQTAHTDAEKALLTWQLIPHTSSVSEQVHLGLESLHMALKGVAALRCARYLLPSVSFPHCTPRQMQALHLTLEYMFTDMFSLDRYMHSSRVFSGFSERSLALTTWLTQTYKNSLQRDLDEIDDNVIKLSEQLRTIRVNLIADKGLANVNYYPVHL